MKNFNLLILLFLFALFLSYKIYYFNKSISLPLKEIKIDKDIFLKQEEDSSFLTNDYLGYIEIAKYDIKSLIKDGTSDYVLNQNIVGVHKASCLIDSSFGNLILAGHNNSFVFKNLIKVKLNDEIKVVSHEKEYFYKVSKIDYIDTSNFSYFDYVYDYKKLTLITCLSKEKRLIIVANLV